MLLSDDGTILKKVDEADIDANGYLIVPIPESVTEIANYAFDVCTGLTELHIPEGVKIDYKAFLGCTGLTALHIPEGIQIAYKAFQGCIGIRELHIPEGVHVSACVFSGCTGLTELHLSEGVQIDEHAFFGCTNLNQIIIDGDEEEVDRIMAMLPEYLQVKAFPKAIYEAAQTHKKAELNKLYHFTTEASSEFHAFFQKAKADKMPELGDGLRTLVKEYVGDETSYHAEARKEIRKYQLPITEEALVGYKEAVTSVAAKYIEMARSVENEEETATAEGCGPGSRHFEPMA